MQLMNKLLKRHCLYLHSQRGSGLLITLGIVSVIGIMVSIYGNIFQQGTETAKKISAYAGQRGGGYHLARLVQNDDLCQTISATMTGDDVSTIVASVRVLDPGKLADTSLMPDPNATRVKLAGGGDILKMMRTVRLAQNHADNSRDLDYGLAGPDDPQGQPPEEWMIRYYQLEQLTPIGELTFRDQYNNVTALTAVRIRAKTYSDNDSWVMQIYVTHDPGTNAITSCLERGSPRYMCLASGRRWFGGSGTIQCD